MADERIEAEVALEPASKLAKTATAKEVVDEAAPLEPTPAPTPKSTAKSSDDDDNLEKKIDDLSAGSERLEKTNANKEEADKKKKLPSERGGMVELLNKTNDAGFEEAKDNFKTAYKESPIAQDIVKAAKGVAELTGLPAAYRGGVTLGKQVDEERVKISEGLGNMRRKVIGGASDKVKKAMGKGMDSMGELGRGAVDACSKRYRVMMESNKQLSDEKVETTKSTPK